MLFSNCNTNRALSKVYWFFNFSSKKKKIFAILMEDMLSALPEKWVIWNIWKSLGNYFNFETAAVFDCTSLCVAFFPMLAYNLSEDKAVSMTVYCRRIGHELFWKIKPEWKAPIWMYETAQIHVLLDMISMLGNVLKVCFENTYSCQNMYWTAVLPEGVTVVTERSVRQAERNVSFWSLVIYKYADILYSKDKPCPFRFWKDHIQSYL